MMQGAFNLEEYINAFKRRKWVLINTTAVIFAIALFVSTTITPVYRSEASILVEQPDVPADLLESTVTRYMIDRIEIFKKRLLTQENLWALGKQLSIVEKDDEVINRSITAEIKNAISIEVEDIKSTTSKSNRPRVTTIAITVGYSAETPELSQLGANKLTDLILETHRRERRVDAEKVTRFLKNESDKHAYSVAEYENKLAEFKQNNITELPDRVSINLALFQKTDAQIDNADALIRSLELKKSALIDQLSSIQSSPSSITSRGTTISVLVQLNILRSEKIHAQSVYGPDHPDIVKLTNEIASLEKQIGNLEKENPTDAQRKLIKSELAILEKKYSSEHPDVRKLREDLAHLDSLKNNNKSEKALFSSDRMDSPDVARIKSELKAAITNLQAAKIKQEELQNKLIEYQTRIYNSPVVEKEYLALERAYFEQLKTYDQVKEKLVKAEIAESVEKDQKGERLSLLEYAQLPLSPDKSDKLGIVLLGGFLAFIGGVGAASTAEFTDHSIHGTHDLISIMDAPPLVSIPIIHSEKYSTIEKRSLTPYLIIFVVLLGVGYFYLTSTSENENALPFPENPAENNAYK